VERRVKYAIDSRRMPRNMATSPIFRLPRPPNGRNTGLKQIALFASALILLAIIGSKWAVAQQSSSLASHYIRTNFTVEDGLPDNVVDAIFHADNGLLWVGTNSGLATFDGREFKAVRLNVPGATSPGAIHAFARATNGDLWVGASAGLLLIPKKDLDQLGPEVTSFFPLGETKSDEVQALLETREGVLWVGTNHGLYRLEGGRFIKAIGSEAISRLAEASNGHLLVVTQRGFIEFDGHRVIEHPGLGRRFGVHDDGIFNVFQDRQGTMWYSTVLGVTREGNHPFVPLGPVAAARLPAYRTYEDQQSNIWISNAAGIYRVNGNDLEELVPVGARCFYAGPDGDIWMGTNAQGLVHLKPRLVRMYTKADGLPNDLVMSVLAAHDGKLWVGSSCGLSFFDGSRFKFYSEKDGLKNSCVWALAEDHNNDLWIGSYYGGLFEFREGHFTQYSVAQGLVSRIVFQITVAQDNSLWIATPVGLSHMEKGHFTNYTTRQGLSSDRILSVHQDHAGTVWVATQAGIDRLTAKGFVAFASSGVEKDTSAIRFMEDSAGDLYAGNLPKGISLIHDDRLTLVNDDLYAMGMAESPDHDLWFSGKDGVIRVALGDLRRAVEDHDAPLDYDRLDRADGLNSLQSSAGTPNIAITPDHKLWIATVKGLAMVDLEQLPTTSHKPKVFVGEVTVDGKKHPALNELILPAGTHHVELHLAAVDLGSPEKTRLQYRMDGVDNVWLDADVSRTAVYTTLPPGTHTFHVRATGSSGKWDRTGIVYDVTQQPLFYQERWFQVACAAFLVMLLSVIYLARVRTIIRQTRILLETRIAERERVARDLHDTFLQGIQGTLLRFHSSTQQLPQSEPLRRTFEEILDQSDAVMLQGRGLVSGLRMTAGDTNDLPIAFAMVGKEFLTLSAAVYNVVVIGETRRLNPIAYDEIVHIGREALFNSYTHATATSIETELDYSSSDLRIRFRDNGTGIDPAVLANGCRAGHYGLPGMRERAIKVGAKLDIYSRLGAGTEVELRVPARVAYYPARGVRGHWLQRLFGGGVL
jgi:ligand-binding sensor domain-containing protein/signal transduction histidine kinase